MSGDVIIFGIMWNFLYFLVSYGSWSVTTCDNYIVFPSGILTVMLFGIIDGGIVGMAPFARWMFAPDSDIDSVYF